MLDPENMKSRLDDTPDALTHTDEDHAAAERERLTLQIAELDRKTTSPPLTP